MDSKLRDTASAWIVLEYQIQNWLLDASKSWLPQLYFGTTQPMMFKPSSNCGANLVLLKSNF